MTAPATPELLFDKQEQVDKILNEGHLLEGERLFAVLDIRGIGSGFIALTDKRMIVYDRSFSGKHMALNSVPYRVITAVASEDQGGWLQRKTSKLSVKAGTDVYNFEFWGKEKAHRGYQILMREILQNEPR